MIVDMFAGVGGFRLGLEKHGFETVWFNQWEPSKKRQDAHDCYVQHFGDFPDLPDGTGTNTDISLVDKNLIPDHALVVGGFPCQDYSVARSGAEGLTGRKGVLWWQIYDVLRLKRPAFALFENVDRLLKSPSKQRGRDFGVMLSCFASLGYSVEWRVVNAADYGGVQKRRRVFIFAWRDDTTVGVQAFRDGKIRVWQESGVLARAFPGEPMVNSGWNVFVSPDPVAVSEQFEACFGDAGCMFRGAVHTGGFKPLRVPGGVLGDVLEPNSNEWAYSPDQLERIEYQKSSKRIPRVTAAGHEYVYSEGAMAFPDRLDLPARTLLTGEGSVSRSSHVVADPGSGVLRRLSPVECERLMGFPDGWTAGMSTTARRFVMGNAVVVGLIDRVGAVLSTVVDVERGKF